MEDKTTATEQLVIVVDDHPLFAKGLAELLDAIAGYKVTATLSDGQKVLDFLDKNTADLLFFDLNMPGMNGIELSLQVRAKYPHISMVAVTAMDHPAQIRKLYDTGIQGFLPKSLTLKETQRALDIIQSGATYFGKEMIELLLEFSGSPAGTEEQPKNDLFTDRELTIIKGICLQKTSKEIAYELSVSIKTIELARNGIMKKMGCINIAGIVVYAIQRKLITMGELSRQFL